MQTYVVFILLGICLLYILYLLTQIVMGLWLKYRLDHYKYVITDRVKVEVIKKDGTVKEYIVSKEIADLIKKEVREHQI